MLLQSEIVVQSLHRTLFHRWIWLSDSFSFKNATYTRKARQWNTTSLENFSSLRNITFWNTESFKDLTGKCRITFCYKYHLNLQNKLCNFIHNAFINICELGLGLECKWLFLQDFFNVFFLFFVTCPLLFYSSLFTGPKQCKQTIIQWFYT